MIIRIMPTHTIDIFACGYFQVYLTQDYKSLREMIYVNLEFISIFIFLTIQANGRSQMDQVGKKTKKKRQKGRRTIC